MRDGEGGHSLGRELMLRTVPLAIVAASGWWFLDAPTWIWLLPVGVAAFVLVGQALRLLVPPPTTGESDAVRDD